MPSPDTEIASDVKPPKVSALLLRAMARECRAMAEAYDKRSLREPAKVERMKAEDLEEASEHLMAYGRALRDHVGLRFTVRDNGRWGWLVRDNEAGKDLLTNKLDETSARTLAGELNARPTTVEPVYALVYAEPPYPEDGSSVADRDATLDRERIYRVEVGANIFYFGDEVGDLEKVARFWRETGAKVISFERPRPADRTETSEDD